MAWKPKQKPLTPDEAMELAKKEFAPYWLGMDPMLAPIASNGKVTCFPLSREFADHRWAFFWIDPLSFTDLRLLSHVREFHRRYHAHDVKFLWVISQTFPGFFDRRSCLDLISKVHIPFPGFLDFAGNLKTAFNVRAEDRIMLIDKGVEALRMSAKNIPGAEVEFQKFLRKKDSGLSLALPFELSSELPMDFMKLEFTAASIGEYACRGEIQKFPDHFEIRKPDAEISFAWLAPDCALVAKSLNGETSRVIVEVDEMPVVENYHGADLKKGEGTKTVLDVGPAGLYITLKNSNSSGVGNKTVTLKFPSAERAPVALYEIRFGK